MKAGASEFLTKPPDREHLLLVVERVVERKALRREVARCRRREAEEFAIVGGKAPSMKNFLENLERVAATDTTVLITGETGTGKELAARVIWERGGRSSKPFVVVNCAILSETLLESDLFGHERGAFTGAVSTKTGMIEEADGGTLFLDEVGEIPPAVQAKLLRVIENGEFQRVGSTTSRTSDVRVVAATNRDLEEEVDRGSFRSDLYHRLSVVTLRLPPLRDRIEDLEDIALHYLGRLGGELGRPEQELSAEVWECMRQYGWPGNIREVRNVLERALVLSPGGEIRPEDIPAGEAAPAAVSVAPPSQLSLSEAMEECKKQIIKGALDSCGGNQTRAAEMLGVNRSSLNRLLKKLELR
jgi:DNA-binding NtrC family response regulator